MPKYIIYTIEELVDFYPTLKKLFIEDEMINVCKLNHQEENCQKDSDLVLSGLHPLLHLIFLNPALEPIMRQVMDHLIQLSLRGPRGSPQFFKLHLDVPRLWKTLF